MIKLERGLTLSSEYGGPALLDHVLGTERDTLRFRLLALVIAATTLYFGATDPAQIAIVPVLATSLTYLAYTLLLGAAIIPWLVPRLPADLSPRILVYLMVAVDAVALNLLMFLVGGPRSAAIILLPLFIIYHSIYLGYVSSLLSATLLPLFFVAFGLFWGETEFLTSFIALQVPFLYLVGVFGGYLSERRLRERWEREKLEQMMLRRGKGGLVGMAGGLDSILDEVSAAAGRVTGLSHTLLALLDPEGKRLVGRAGSVTPAELGLISLDRLVFDVRGSSATSQALREGRPVIVGDAIREAHKLPGWAQSLGAGTMLLVPLLAEGRSWGVLYVFSVGARQAVSRLKLDLLKGYARLAARALAGAGGGR